MDRPVLRDAIVAHLRDAGSDSISGVARALGRLPGAPVHRLTVAGYLAALTDEGVLREVDRPPSKHYQLAHTGRHRTLHQRIGDAVAALQVPAPDRPAVAVAALEHLLGRPVFAAELRAAGFPHPGRGVETLEASEDDRRTLRALFREDGPHPMEIPRGDPLLRARAGAVSQAVVLDAVRRTTLESTGASALVHPAPPQRGVQAHLSLEEGG